MASGRIWVPLFLIAITIPVTLAFKNAVFDQPPGDYEVQALFNDASGLVENSKVKIGGVDAGAVTKMELTSKDQALVTMRLEDGAGPIGADATAAARPVNLLGEKYVDLEVGDLDRPQPSGVRVPLKRTRTPVELDDVFNTLDPSVRARLRILVNEAGIMLAGRGADFNGLLAELPPAVDEIGDLVAEVEAESERLGQVIEAGDRVLAPIAKNRDDLADLVDSAGDALEVAADRRAELTETFERAPAALTGLRSTLSELGTTADELRPAAVGLRRTAAPLTQTLENLPEFTDAARETLKVAEDAAPTLSRLGREGRTTVARLQPTLRNLDEVTGEADPLLEQLAEGGSFLNLLELMNGWAEAIKRSDGLGHTFGIRSYVSMNTIRHVLQQYGAGDALPRSQGTPRRSRRAPAPGAERPTGPRAPARRQQGVVPDVLRQVEDLVRRPVRNLIDSAGAGSGQAPAPKNDPNGLLDFLLGS